MNKSQPSLYSLSRFSNQEKMSEAENLETKEIYCNFVLKNKERTNLTGRQKCPAVQEFTRIILTQSAVEAEPWYFTHI